MVEMEIPIEEILAVKRPDELEIEPPMKAKILAVEVEPREVKNSKGQTVTVPYLVFRVRRLATKQDDGTWRETIASKPFGLYYKVSKRKDSKYGKLIEALWEVAEDIMKNAKTLKDLEGAIFVFENKEVRLGNIISRVWLPVELVGIEPVSEEEKEMLKRDEEIENKAEELAREVLG